MDSGTVLVALVVTGMLGCVSTVAILFGTTRIKANKEGIDLEAASQENPKPNRTPARKHQRNNEL